MHNYLGSGTKILRTTKSNPKHAQKRVTHLHSFSRVEVTSSMSDFSRGCPREAEPTMVAGAWDPRSCPRTHRELAELPASQCPSSLWPFAACTCLKPSLAKCLSRSLPLTAFVKMSAGLFLQRTGSMRAWPSLTLSCTQRYLVCTCRIRPSPWRVEKPRAALLSDNTSKPTTIP